MTKIELTPQEIEMIETYLKYDAMPDVSFEPTTNEEKALTMSVLRKANALMRELDAYDELGESLLEWFYNKYKEQQAQEQR